jgi:putative aldouronate transport system permease protein
MAVAKSVKRSSVKSGERKKGILYYLIRDKYLYLLCVPAIIYIFIFKYIPMYGVTIAFKDYNIFQGTLASPWVGLDVFKEVFAEEFFWIATRNTLILNILTIAVNFPLTIVLSLMLNEVNCSGFKRVTQSILYLPHFVSWVVVAGIVTTNLLSVRNGVVNNLLGAIGIGPIGFLVDEGWWLFSYVLSNVWKEIGWGTIIYLAALSGVDETLYEAAYIDGATKLKRIWYITLPAIKPTIVMMLILTLSKSMSIGLDAPLLLGNDKVINVSEVLSTYVYKIGLQKTQYSLATAIGLFQSVVNIILLVLANKTTKLLGEEGVM